MTEQEHVYWGPPPYSDVVFHPNTQQRLRPEHVGALCWFIRHARPFGKTQWAVSATLKQIAADMGVSVGAVSRYIDRLNATGFITSVRSMPRTEKSGSTPQTHYLTYHECFGTPERDDNPPPPPLRAIPSPQNGEIQNRDVGFRDVAFSVVDNSPPRGNGLVEIVESDIPKHQPELVGGGLSPTSQKMVDVPETVKSAFAAIGWYHEFPIPTHYPWDALLALVEYARREPSVKDAARFVHNAIKRDAVMDLVKDRGLLGTDPHGRFPARSAAPKMDPVVYDQMKELNPQWAAKVREEARRQALLLNRKYIPPSLEWEIALTVPFEHATGT